jgi:hypothetical protein
MVMVAIVGALLRVDSFLAVTIGILVLFVGKRLNEKGFRVRWCCAS